VTNGVFTVMLGSVNPLTVAVFDTARYLSVQAGAEREMVPRQALGASPFAIQAQQANQLAAGPRSRGASHGALSGATSRVPGHGTITAATISAHAHPVAGQLAAGCSPPRQPPSHVDATGNVGIHDSLAIGADGLPGCAVLRDVSTLADSQ